MKNPKVFVIGGTGFIGSAVTKELLDADCEVAVMHRGRRELPDQEVHVYQGDRKNMNTLRKALSDFQPSIIVDMVAYTAEDAWTLRQTLNDKARHLVVASSGDVYHAYEVFRDGEGDLAQVPIKETAQLRTRLYPYRDNLLPDSEENNFMYNYEKILVEQVLLHERRLSTTILRLPAVYGENDRRHKLGAYLQPMMRNEKEILLDEQKANWRWTRGYVRNIAHGIALATLRDTGRDKIYNIGEMQPLTERELIEELAALTEWPGAIVLLPKEELPEQRREPFHFEQHLVLDTRRIREELDYEEPFEWEAGMRQTLAYEEGVV